MGTVQQKALGLEKKHKKKEKWKRFLTWNPAISYYVFYDIQVKWNGGEFKERT